MPELASIFDASVTFDPSSDLDAFVKQAPARWAVYLLADESDQPVQLLCVKNLRASLRRRLGGQEIVGLSKKVNYREVVRRVYWRRVDSAFEADWIYLEAARRLFPESYRGMVGFRPAWFVHVDPQAAFPRYTKTIDLSQKDGLLIGPIEDKHAAARLIQLAEDAFDLCRYYNILLAAPHGKACAYKEMGKCPAPCDGSISMDEYRRMMQRSADAIVDPQGTIAELTARMKEASAGLQFERAARIKARVDQVSQFEKGPFRHAQRLEDFRFVSLERGPAAGTARVFLITQGQIQPVASLIGEPQRPAELLRYILSAASRESQSDRSVRTATEAAERIAIVSHHLFSAKQSQGIIIRLAHIDESSLQKAWRVLRTAVSADAPLEESEDEGIVRELNSI